MLLLLPLHSFAMQGGWLSAGNAFDVAHEIEHAMGVSHHHHDDGRGSIHYDDSGESAAHFAEHASAHQCAALLPAAIPQLAIASITIKIPDHEQYIPNPVPERLHRPPSSRG
jgi:hypothetical protein